MYASARRRGTRNYQLIASGGELEIDNYTSLRPRGESSRLSVGCVRTSQTYRLRRPPRFILKKQASTRAPRAFGLALSQM